MEEGTPKSPGPLSGVKVLDLTAVVLGPVATQVLGDYGADVIKIEPPDGDIMRANGVGRTPRMSSTFMNINRNKRSLCIDLKTPKGMRIIHRLIQRSDVLVHNMRVRAIERLGLGYEQVRQINPSIVYCAATGYGEDGDYAGKPTFDDIVQAGCGLASLIGHESGVPDYAPTLLADKIAGLATANAVLAAVVHQSRTGQGQYVEVPMFETMVAFTMAEHLGGHGFVPAIGDAGYARLLKGGRRPYKTLDGYVAVLPYSGKHYRRFLEAFDRQDLLQKYDLEDRTSRNKNIQAIYGEIAKIVCKQSTERVLEVCLSIDVPATSIYSIHNIQDHPQVKTTRLFTEMQHPTEGGVQAVRPTALFSETPTRIYRHAPLLGEDNASILSEIGLDSESEAENDSASGLPASTDR